MVEDFEMISIFYIPRAPGGGDARLQQSKPDCSTAGRPAVSAEVDRGKWARRGNWCLPLLPAPQIREHRRDDRRFGVSRLDSWPVSSKFRGSGWSGGALAAALAVRVAAAAPEQAGGCGKKMAYLGFGEPMPAEELPDGLRWAVLTNEDDPQDCANTTSSSCRYRSHGILPNSN